MKRLVNALAISALLTVTASLFAASNQELLKSIPQSSGVTIAIDVAKIIDLPAVKDARARDPELEKQFQELESKLAAHNLTIKDMVSNFVVFSDESNQFGGLLASSKLGEANLEALLKGEIFSSPASDYSVETIQGHKTYIVKDPKSPIIPNQDALPSGIASKQLTEMLSKGANKTVAITFLDKETLLIMELPAYEKYLAAGKGMNAASTARSTSVDLAAPVWGVINMPRKAQANNPAPNAFADRITGFAFSLATKGQAKEDIAIRVCLECIDAPAAAATCTQIQGLIFMMNLNSGKNGQPSPFTDILNNLVLDNKDKFITMDLTLSKKTLDSLGKQNPFGAPQLGAGAPKAAPAIPK